MSCKIDENLYFVLVFYMPKHNVYISTHVYLYAYGVLIYIFLYDSYYTMHPYMGSTTPKSTFQENGAQLTDEELTKYLATDSQRLSKAPNRGERLVGWGDLVVEGDGLDGSFRCIRRLK